MPRPRKPANPFRCFNSSPEVIRLVMMYVRFPLSLSKRCSQGTAIHGMRSPTRLAG